MAIDPARFQAEMEREAVKKRGKKGKTRRIFTERVVGVTFENEDGTNRQEILRTCEIGDEVVLVRNPQDPYDRNAIRVCLSDGSQLGHLSSECAASLAPLMDRGKYRYEAEVEAVAGGFDAPIGCRIAITEYTKEKLAIEEPRRFGSVIRKVAGYFVAFCILSIIVALGMPREEQKPYVVRNPQPPLPDIPEWDRQRHPTEALLMMQRFVKDRLKSPRSAEFPGVFDGVEDHVKYIGGHIYQVTSWVDSQNAFGANIRTRYVGEIRQEDEDKWTLVSLKLAE